MSELRSRAAAIFGAVSSALGVGLACSGGSMTSASATASTSTSEVMSTTATDSASTEGSTLTGTSGGTSTSTGGGTSTSTSTSTGEVSSTGDTETGCSFLGCETSDSGCDAAPGLDGVVRCTLDCDVWLQDCPEGAKCTAWASDGGSSWNATKCAPVDPDPKAPGEACVVFGEFTSGEDTCEVGAMCWNVGPGMNEGTCVGLCDGSENDPSCAEPGTYCAIINDGALNLCLPNCDPLAQDSPDGDMCLPVGVGFGCVLDASGDAGAYGDPCEYANACDPGLVCLNPEYVPDCMAGGCCSPLCETTAPNTCPGDGQVCIPWFEEGQAPAGYENVGVCGIPQ